MYKLTPGVARRARTKEVTKPRPQRQICERFAKKNSMTKISTQRAHVKSHHGRRRRPLVAEIRLAADPLHDEAWTLTRYLLAAAIYFGNNDTIERVRRTGLSVNHVRELDHRSAATLAGCYAIAKRGENVDAYSVYLELKESGEIDKVGGPLAIFEIPETIPLHAANCEYWAAKIRLLLENQCKARNHRIAAEILNRDIDDPLRARDKVRDVLGHEIAGVS